MKAAIEELIGYMLWCACVVIAFVLLPGCTNKIADISLAPPPAQTCPKLVMPPVPDDVVLDIKGSKVTANKGGEVMLIGYARARELLRPSLPGAAVSSNPH